MTNQYRVETRAARKAMAVAMTLTLALCASFAAYAQPQGDTAKKSSEALSRAEVIADLALWRRADVDHYELARSYHLETQAYQAAHQEYLRLRSSEQFALEVQKALGN